MSNAHLVAGLGAGLLVGACAMTPPGQPVAQTLGSDLDRLEALFRYQMANNASGQRQNAGVYCLALGGTDGGDPPPALIARFDQSQVPVVPRSSCTIAPVSEGNVVRLEPAGPQGLILYVSSVACTSADRCTAQGGYYEANLSASGNSYTLVRSNGRWTVARGQMQWIS